jgi:predicted permease
VTKELYRAQRAARFFDGHLRDVRAGLRSLLYSPGFTTISILTLAFGIGASTGIFALVNALLLRPLPIRRPDQIVQITNAARTDSLEDLSIPVFEELQHRETGFSSVFAWWGPGIMNVEAGGELTRGLVWAVTGNCYSQLGVQPLLGRFLDDADVKLDQGNPELAAVIGYQFWQRYYGGDPTVIGKKVLVEGSPFTVVGVARQGFTGLAIASEPDVTIALTAKPLITGESTEKLYSSAGAWLSIGARIRDGGTLDQARSQLESVWLAVLDATAPPEYSADERAGYLASRVQVSSLEHGDALMLRKRFTAPSLALLAISILILLIACLNLANVTLARTSSRAHEISVRIALGASRWRIARQLLTENLMLSSVGAALGLWIGFEGSRWLRGSILRSYIQPNVLKVGPDARVITFAIGAAILTAALCGAASVLKATRQQPAGALRHDSRMSANSGALGRPLIVAQIALSFVLLTCAGLFMHSFAKLRALNPVSRTKDKVIAGLSRVPGGYKNQDDSAYYPELLRRVWSVPGVRSASLIQSIPVSNFSIGVPIATDEESTGASAVTSDVQSVAPRFFESYGIEILRGRDFTWQDNAKGRPVAILGQRVADELFPSQDPLGRHIRIGSASERQNVEIVGVVSNAAIWNPREPESREVYVPLLQGGARWATLIISTASPPQAAIAAIASEVDGLGHEHLYQPRGLAEQLDRSILEESLTATLSEYFGALALILSAIGLYGLVSYSINRRTREIGIRLALGAERRNILGMILRETFILIVGGTAIGVICALAAGRAISHMLYRISPYDAVTLLIVGGALALTGAVACYLPALRATRIDPAVALRYE